MTEVQRSRTVRQNEFCQLPGIYDLLLASSTSLPYEDLKPYAPPLEQTHISCTTSASQTALNLSKQAHPYKLVDSTAFLSKICTYMHCHTYFSPPPPTNGPKQEQRPTAYIHSIAQLQEEDKIRKPEKKSNHFTNDPKDHCTHVHDMHFTTLRFKYPHNRSRCT